MAPDLGAFAGPAVFVLALFAACGLGMLLVARWNWRRDEQARRGYRPEPPKGRPRGPAPPPPPLPRYPL